MRAPCKDCKDRETGCHGKCARYKQWKNEHARELENRRRQAEELDTRIRGLERMLNTRNRK